MTYPASQRHIAQLTKWPGSSQVKNHQIPLENGAGAYATISTKPMATSCQLRGRRKPGQTHTEAW